jgi:myosin heavy subunit
MQELERIFVHRIGKLRAAVKEGEALVAGEAQRAEQLVESFRINIATLETKLKETEDAVRRKELARQEMEESLTAKIQDLQNDVKKKEEVLKSRGDEINDLKFHIDGQVKQVAELEFAVQAAKVEAASQATRAEHLTESSKAKIAALEAQLRDAERIGRQMESTIKGLQQNLTAKMRELETQVKNKEEVLASRDAEINDLKSELKLLTKGIRDMSSFFRHAETLADVEVRGSSSAVLKEPVNREEEKPVPAESKPAKVTPAVPHALPEIVSRDLFHCISGELSEVTRIMGPMTSIIVRDHVVALGESMEKFPKTRLPELLESLSKEMLDENRKIEFRKRLAHHVQNLGESD